MARPLRLNLAGGWYHVFHRATERGVLFHDSRDRVYFLELLSASVERYRIAIHAYVLMDTHYHALIQTPEANLSFAMQWLHVSYAAWYNARHNRRGPFWQGRFCSVPVEGGDWCYTVSHYLHLNPVCTVWHGLDKRSKRAEALGWKAPDKAVATERLRQLRTYPWSSYRAYAGYVTPPAWLRRDDVLALAHREPCAREKQYRMEAQEKLTRGTDAATLERLLDRVGIGQETFLKHLKALARGGVRETRNKRAYRRRVLTHEVFAAIAAVRGEPWERCGLRRGDWARPMAMWIMRRSGGLTLREIGVALGGMDYAAVGMALKRFERRLIESPKLRNTRQRTIEMLNVET